MGPLIIVLLVLWVALIIIGFAINALLWLAIAGIVLFVATSIYGRFAAAPVELAARAALT
jgi:hypothetical protein